MPIRNKSLSDCLITANRKGHNVLIGTHVQTFKIFSVKLTRQTIVTIPLSKIYDFDYSRITFKYNLRTYQIKSASTFQSEKKPIADAINELLKPKKKRRSYTLKNCRVIPNENDSKWCEIYAEMESDSHSKFKKGTVLHFRNVELPQGTNRFVTRVATYELAK